MDRAFWGGVLPRSGRTLRLLARGFGVVGIPMRAGQLTYLTALSLVPLLAVVYSIAQWIFGEERIHARLDAFVRTQLSIGTSGQFAETIHRFLHAAADLRGISFAFLFLSSLSLLFNTEAAFNAIFHAKSARPPPARAATYFVLLVVGPLALAMSLVTAALWGHGGAAMLSGAIAPYVLSVTAFAILYLLLPNVRVDPRAAAFAALMTGLIWEMAKHAFAFASARLFSFGKIYGALGAIPVFLLWLWVSWMVVLLGARLTYALQASRHPQMEVAIADPWARQLWATRLLVALGAGPASVDELAARLQAHPDGLELILGLLQTDKLVEHRENAFMLTTPLERVTLAEVRRAVVPWPDIAGDAVLAAISEAETEVEGRLAVRLQDFV